MILSTFKSDAPYCSSVSQDSHSCLMSLGLYHSLCPHCLSHKYLVGTQILYAYPLNHLLTEAIVHVWGPLCCILLFCTIYFSSHSLLFPRRDKQPICLFAFPLSCSTLSFLHLKDCLLEIVRPTTLSKHTSLVERQWIRFPSSFNTSSQISQGKHITIQR